MKDIRSTGIKFMNDIDKGFLIFFGRYVVKPFACKLDYTINRIIKFERVVLTTKQMITTIRQRVVTVSANEKLR